jgi:kynurenine 3-monooxygenase
MQSTRLHYSQEFLEHGYKELTIPPTTDGSFCIEPNALHIWPRGGFMMIALPNLDRSFTSTLFLPHLGSPVGQASSLSRVEETGWKPVQPRSPGFDQLDSPAKVREFFAATFPDAAALIANLEAEFFRNPTGGLVTVRCAPWHHAGQVLLLGDAAHAIVPFFGQGMNCAFEDCAVLLNLFDEFIGEWEEIFPRFFESRKANADAIAQLALDNFIEMRDTSADPHFALKRQVEHLLEERYPGQFASKYAMVSFQQVPYAEALARGRVQDAILIDACSRAGSLAEIDIPSLFAAIRDRARAISESHLP